jgi:hypothetical protein
VARRKRDFDAGLPAWLVELLKAGRELATLVEEDVQACGNAPPHDRENCEDCRPQREALMRWVSAVVTARKANGQ